MWVKIVLFLPQISFHHSPPALYPLLLVISLSWISVLSLSFDVSLFSRLHALLFPGPLVSSPPHLFPLDHSSVKTQTALGELWNDHQLGEITQWIYEFSVNPLLCAGSTFTWHHSLCWLSIRKASFSLLLYEKRHLSGDLKGTFGNIGWYKGAASYVLEIKQLISPLKPRI